MNHHPIPKEYHPSNAARKEVQGLFNIYHFKDGAKLTVRKMYESKIFRKWWHLWRPRQVKTSKASLSDRREVHSFQIGPVNLIVRQINGSKQSQTLLLLRAMYERLSRSRVRFETPVAWLQAPRELLVTKLKRGYSPFSEVALDKMDDGPFMSKVLQSAFFELGKMHGAGIAHGHPHYDNLLVNQEGNVCWVDPKFLRGVSDEPIVTSDLPERRSPATLGIVKQFCPGDTVPQGVRNDLHWLASYMVMAGHARLGLESMVEKYRRGVGQGKRRVVPLKV